MFGGGPNIRQGVKNAFDVYNPDIIAVHTTCLSETIGDDLNTYIEEMDIPDGKYVVHCNTPSYVGSHITGFGNMMAGFIKYLAAKGTATQNVAVFPRLRQPRRRARIQAPAPAHEAQEHHVSRLQQRHGRAHDRQVPDVPRRRHHH